MAPKKRVSRAAAVEGSSLISRGSKRKVRETGSSSSFRSVPFNVDEQLISIDSLIKKLELTRGERKHLVTVLEENFEDMLFVESDCEDEEEKEDLELGQTGFDGLKIKEKGSSSSSASSSMEVLHLKTDLLIKLVESEHKKHKCFSTFSSSSIPRTRDGFYSKLDRVSELLDLEKKKQRRLINYISTFMKSKCGFVYPRYETESEEEEEDFEEEESCMLA